MRLDNRASRFPWAASLALLVAGSPAGCSRTDATDAAVVQRAAATPIPAAATPAAATPAAATPATPAPSIQTADADADALAPSTVRIPPLPVDASPRKEFEAYAKALLEGTNMYLGLTPMRQLEQGLARPNLPSDYRYRILMELADLEVREGRPADGIAHHDEAGRILESLRPQLGTGVDAALAQFHQARATAYMRLAENLNCVTGHGADSCILPFRGSAVHANQSPGREAMKEWLEVCRLRPGDGLAGWLLNINAMTVGEHPAGVPPELRLDFNRYQAVTKLGEMRDVAAKVGIHVFNMAGGMVVEDFDGDGLLDVVMTTSDPEGSMPYYRNAGDGTFTDVAAGSGLDQQLGGLNAVSTDYDNDGHPDILVLRGGWLAQDGRVRKSLLHNDGHGRFEDVTRAAGLAEIAFPTQVGVWGDFDNDGDLDLFVGDEVSIGQDGKAAPYPAQLFRNNGNGTFTEMAAAAGLTNDRHTKGAAAGDYDNDGDLDLYVSNIGANRLYRNEGNLRFVDVAAEAGVMEPVGRSFAPWFFDYDDDGWLDIWVPAYDANPADLANDLRGQPFTAHLPRLYHNQHDGTFKDVAREMGLVHPFLPMGANFGDIDFDGWLDIYLGTGDPSLTSLMPNVMLHNEGGKRFSDVTSQTRLGQLQKGHGVAFVDIDNDGDEDILHQIGGFAHVDKFHSALYMNPGGSGHFLYVSLVGVKSNRPGIGARIEVEVATPSGVRVLHRAAGSVSSFGGSSLFRQEIGLGDATSIKALRVWWPTSGIRQSFTDVPLDAHVEVREDAAEVKRLPLRKIGLGK